MKNTIKLKVNQLLGRRTFATFDYVDRQEKKSKPLVEVNSLKRNEHGNLQFYSFAKNGRGGGIRQFKPNRVSNFRLL
jgi:hypothetical protein